MDSRLLGPCSRGSSFRMPADRYHRHHRRRLRRRMGHPGWHSETPRAVLTRCPISRRPRRDMRLSSPSLRRESVLTPLPIYATGVKREEVIVDCQRWLMSST